MGKEETLKEKRSRAGKIGGENGSRKVKSANGKAGWKRAARLKRTRALLQDLQIPASFLDKYETKDHVSSQ